MAFPASSPLVGSISRLDFLGSAKKSGSFMLSITYAGFERHSRSSRRLCASVPSLNRCAELAQAVTHLVMDIDAIEKEPAHPRALARVMDRQVLEFRCRAVLIQNIEALSTMLRIRHSM